jgi:hypothetical protein
MLLLSISALTWCVRLLMRRWLGMFATLTDRIPAVPDEDPQRAAAAVHAPNPSTVIDQ